PRHLADAAHVLGSMFSREPEVGVEAVADVVTVQPVRSPSLSDQGDLDGGGDGRLPGTGEPGEPHGRPRSARHPTALLAGDLAFVPGDVSRHDSVGPMIIPAPTVLLVASSTRMNAPVSRLRR